MHDINGFTEEEAQFLVSYIADGKKEGKTLSKLFESYAQKTGRARGSVRNYYYALLKSTDDPRVKKLLDDAGLSAENQNKKLKP